jgi:hypothetical protein
MFGKASPVLGDFGYTTKTAQKPSAAIKAVAVEKRAATRAARHTQGKRQKAKITGTPPVVVPSGASGSGPTPKT